MNLQSGTRPMEASELGTKKLGLSTDDVLRIIEASAHCKVLVLKFQGLEIEFGKQVEPDPTPGSPRTSALPKTPPPVAEMTVKEIKELAKEALEQGELEFREALVEELKIVNPVLYEELIRQGELEDDTDDGANGDGEE